MKNILNELRMALAEHLLTCAMRMVPNTSDGRRLIQAVYNYNLDTIEHLRKDLTGTGDCPIIRRPVGKTLHRPGEIVHYPYQEEKK